METRTIITKAKNINNNIKLLINGYIKSITGKQNVALIINYLIITFYSIIDKFTLSNEQNSKNYLTLTNNKRVNIMQNAVYKSWAKYTIIYCEENIIQYQDTSVAKYQWTFKFTDGPYNAMSFGIISSQPRHIKENKWKIEGIKYHKVYSHGLISNFNEIEARSIGQAINPGIIHFDLDINNSKLSFTPHGSQNEYTISNQVDVSSTEFCFAIEVPILTTNYVELVNFTIKHNYLPHAFRDIMNHLPQNYQFELPPETTLNENWIAIFSNQYIK